MQSERQHERGGNQEACKRATHASRVDRRQEQASDKLSRPSLLQGLRAKSIQNAQRHPPRNDKVGRRHRISALNPGTHGFKAIMVSTDASNLEPKTLHHSAIIEILIPIAANFHATCPLSAAAVADVRHEHPLPCLTEARGRDGEDN